MRRHCSTITGPTTWWESTGEYPFHCDDGAAITTTRSDFLMPNGDGSFSGERTFTVIAPGCPGDGPGTLLVAVHADSDLRAKQFVRRTAVGKLPLRFPAGFRLRRMTSQHAKRAEQRPSARQAGDARRIEAYRANSKATPEFPRVVKGAAPSAQATCMMARAAQPPKEKSCGPRCRFTAICSPDGIRTHATAVRGRRPRPLDDGAGTGVPA